MRKFLFLIIFLIVTISCKKEKTVNSFSQEKTTENKINFHHYLFNTTNNTEEKITLEKGTTYVLDFWYLECVPCVKQHKQIQEYQEVLKQNKIEIIGVSIDKDKIKWEEYLEKHSYNWKNYNQFGDNENLKNNLNLKLFPTYLIINSKGDVLKKYNSFQQTLAYFKIS